MDLTREAIEKIEEMAEVTVVDIEGIPYSKDKLNPVSLPKPSALTTRSLTGLVDYLKANVDELRPEELIIHIYDCEHVALISSLDGAFRKREEYLMTEALLPNITLNSFMDRESFNIMLQSRFVDIADRAAVLASIGKMRYENEVKMEDDGITQTVASKAGVALVREEQIPNPVRLAPFRTFTEVEQPISPFILLVDDKCRVGLFEADGGAWRNEAMKKIKEYLDYELSGDYTIIA
ncbi:MAG: hypothetical protein ACK5MK_15540 [Dysgonomonas sp.]